MSTKLSVTGLITGPPWLSDAEQRAWRGYRRMRALLDLQLARDLAQETGLSGADYDVLSTISETEQRQMRLGDLARWLLWSKSRLSHHITRMQRRGLVTREEYESDARGSVVVLTDQGWRAIQAAAPGHVASVRRHMIDLLTEDELAALDTLSHRVVDHLTAETGDTRDD